MHKIYQITNWLLAVPLSFSFLLWFTINHEYDALVNNFFFISSSIQLRKFSPISHAIDFFVGSLLWNSTVLQCRCFSFDMDKSLLKTLFGIRLEFQHGILFTNMLVISKRNLHQHYYKKYYCKHNKPFAWIFGEWKCHRSLREKFWEFSL